MSGLKMVQTNTNMGIILPHGIQALSQIWILYSKIKHHLMTTLVDGMFLK